WRYHRHARPSGRDDQRIGHAGAHHLPAEPQAMSTAYSVPPRRDLISRVAREIDDFMSWMLYGSETWLVALLKGVPLFLFVYFVLGYLPNYAKTMNTPSLGLSQDRGFL